MSKKTVMGKAKAEPQRVIKTSVNAVLIAFIVFSLCFAAYKAVDGKKKATVSPEATVVTAMAPEATTAPQPEKEAAKVVLYYLHATGRCSRCILMEQYSKEAVEKYFSNELNNGGLEFKVLNFDEPQNSHYFRDYKLTTKSLVITLVKGGKEKKYENLTGIWENSGNQEAFHQYVKSNVEKYLQEAK